MDPRFNQPLPPLATRAQMERIGEPWALSRTFTIIITLVFAVLLGSWTASGQISNVILVAVWFGATMIIIFVQDYWWSPALVITAFSFGTTALGFPMSGMEIGVIILLITFPIKMAMKTLRKAEPEMGAGIFYWLLFTYVAAHAVIIFIYNEIEGTPVLKNIVKAYYTALVPLAFFGLLVRYCHPRTVRPTVLILFFVNVFTVGVSLLTVIFGIDVESFTDLRITLGWLTQAGAEAILRYAASLLFIGCLAFWPAIRHRLGKLSLVFGLVLSAVAVLVSGGRLALALCIAAGIFFAFIRRKAWVSVPFILFAVLTSLVITTKPDLLYDLPLTVQRGLAPLNFSTQKTEIQAGLAGSDEWHQDLRNRSIDYWTEDGVSFYLGHGYKSWDSTIDMSGDVDEADRERIAELAIEMGLTENMFSSITNIFGLVGLILYAGFLGTLAWKLFKGARRTPYGSDARALCEFSLINLIGALVFSPFMGTVPNLNLVYWGLGLLAVRPYLVSKIPGKDSKSAPAPAQLETPAFARPAFAEQRARFQRRSV